MACFNSSLSSFLELASDGLVTANGPSPPPGQMDLKRLILASVLPVVKVLCIAGVGLFLATPYMNVLHTEARKNISRLVFVLLLPALVFVKLGQGVDFTNIFRWYFIPVNVVVGCSVGCALGYIVCLICRPPKEYWRLVVFLTGVGNMGNLPLVLVTAVCSDPNNPFGSSKDCLTVGVAYVAFGMWPLAIILWTFVYNALALPETMSVSVGASVRTQRQSLEKGSDEGATVPLLARRGGEGPNFGEQVQRLWKTVVGFLMYLRLHQILRPPILGALLALVVGSIPPVKSVMFAPEGALRFVIDSISIIGQAMIPCLLLTLGGNMSGGPGSSSLNLATNVGIVIMRLVVLPLLGMCFVLAADHFKLLIVPDKMYRFVLLLQHTMPTSIQVGTAATLRGYGEREVSAALFYEHIAAIVTITGFLFVYLHHLFPS